MIRTTMKQTVQLKEDWKQRHNHVPSLKCLQGGKNKQTNKKNRHEFVQTPGDGEGQGSLVCCSQWGHKEMDMTEQ